MSDGLRSGVPATLVDGFLWVYALSNQANRGREKIQFSKIITKQGLAMSTAGIPIFFLWGKLNSLIRAKISAESIKFVISGHCVNGFPKW